MKTTMRELLEQQIIQDANNGDTTVLAEILTLLSDKQVYASLGDEQQSQVNECYGAYAVSTSDGHDEDWTYADTREEADRIFEESKECGDVHLYEYKEKYGYEVIDSFWDGETGM
jgi:hypothetical protein